MDILRIQVLWNPQNLTFLHRNQVRFTDFKFIVGIVRIVGQVVPQ